MSRRTEIQVGTTVLAAIAILVLGVAWLKDYSVERDTRLYRVSFTQAGGLSASDEVQVNGIRKGEVKAMRLAGDHVEVDLRLTRDVVLTTDSRVAIRNVGLMGERVISVDLKTTGRRYAPGEIVPGVYEYGPGELMGQLAGTVDAFSDVAQQFRRLADSLGANNRLSRTLANFTRTSEELEQAVAEDRALLHATLQNFSAASNTAKRLTTDREAQLRQALDHFGDAAERLDHLSGRLDSLRAVMQSLAARVQDGQGTLGKLVSDDKLYDQLNTSIVSLKSLIEDVRAHPKKYLKLSIF